MWHDVHAALLGLGRPRRLRLRRLPVRAAGALARDGSARAEAAHHASRHSDRHRPQRGAAAEGKDRQHARAGLSGSAPRDHRRVRLLDRPDRRHRARVRRSHPARQSAGAPRKRGGAAAGRRGRVGRDPDLQRRRDRAPPRRRIEHRRQLRGSERRLRQQRRSVRGRRRPGQRRRRLRALRDVASGARDAREQPRRPQRFVLCRAARGLPSMGRRSAERFQHAAERRRARVARRARCRHRRLLPEHRRHATRVAPEDADGRTRHRRARAERAHAEPRPLRLVRVAAREPTARRSPHRSVSTPRPPSAQRPTPRRCGFPRIWSRPTARFSSPGCASHRASA